MRSTATRLLQHISHANAGIRVVPIVCSIASNTANTNTAASSSSFAQHRHQNNGMDPTNNTSDAVTSSSHSQIVLGARLYHWRITKLPDVLLRISSDYWILQHEKNATNFLLHR